jgi:hypothetical protein
MPKNKSFMDSVKDAFSDSKLLDDDKVSRSLGDPANRAVYYPPDIIRHSSNPDKLHQVVDQSHQEHKAVTGQVPNAEEDYSGYTTYQHQGSYYVPGSED